MRVKCSRQHCRPLHLHCGTHPCHLVRGSAQGFNPTEVPDKYGSKLYFWNWKERVVTQEIELGADGLVPLEVNLISGQGRGGSACRKLRMVCSMTPATDAVCAY